MTREYHQQTIDEMLLDDLRQLIRLSVREDLDRRFDLTTLAIVPPDSRSVAHVGARQTGVAAGLELVPAIIEEMELDAVSERFVDDGTAFDPGERLLSLRGDTRDLLTGERVILNVLGRLCGIATLTHEFATTAGAQVRLYDTRKTTPGWRRLEKYAVRCGGGMNHRGGLYDAILIKDNHLACRADITGSVLSPKEAIEEARLFIANNPQLADDPPIIEIEVDTIEQLESALQASPDIILLDNMPCDILVQAVAMRNAIPADFNRATGHRIELEASGGVRLNTIAAIAETGVDRISVGALTHSAINLDLGLDWESS